MSNSSHCYILRPSSNSMLPVLQPKRWWWEVNELCPSRSGFLVLRTHYILYYLVNLIVSSDRAVSFHCHITVSFYCHCVCSTPLFRNLYLGSNAIKGLRWFGNFIHCQPTIVYRFKYICTTKRSNRFFNRSIQNIIIINQNRVWLVWLKCSTFHTLFLCFVSDSAKRFTSSVAVIATYLAPCGTCSVLNFKMYVKSKLWYEHVLSQRVICMSPS